MTHPGLRRSSRSIIATLACSAMLASVLIGVGQGPAGAVTPPVAVNDAYSTGTGTPLTQAAPGVLTNDADDGPPASLTASGASDPPHGAVSLSANGSFTYTADANFVGTDTFTYTVSDGVDGSSTGTVTITVFRNPAVLLKDINAGPTSSTPIRAVDLGNGTAVFITWDGLNRGIYKTDGTAAGTVQVKAVDTGSTGDSPLTPGPIYIGGGRVVFYANDGVNGREPWVSDGTTAGTFMLADINSGSASSNPNNFTAIGGGIALFNANDGTTGSQHGVELWRTDGTSAGTSLVLDINTGTASGSPNCGSLTVAGYAVLGSNAYFCATTVASGSELWRSDGTAAGTQMVAEIRASTASSSPNNLAVFNGAVYFGANDGSTGTELWKSDGTGAGTVLVKDINAGSASGSPGRGLTPFGSVALFAATTAANGQELFVTDGTAAGTTLVKDIRPGTGNSQPNQFTPFGGSVLFVASDGVTGLEVWKTDGTAGGTVLVKDIEPGSASSQPSSLTVFGGLVYMWAFNSTYWSELWQSDGTTAGTVLAQDINPGMANAASNDIRPALGTLLFGAITAANGNELWRAAPPNTPPVANNDGYSTNEDTPLTVNAPGVVGNDTDADNNVLHDAVKFTDPAHGSVAFNGNGSFTYTPAANYNGPDSFTYKSYDGMDYSNAATVNITVTSVLDTPVAVTDTYSTNQNASLTVASPGVLGNDTDGDGDALTASSPSLPAHGAVALNPGGGFTYTPNANYTGPDSFTYTVSDGSLTATGTVNISVSVPTISASPASVSAGSPVTATWSGVGNPSATDWVGLYDSASAANLALLAWAYTGGGAAGNLNLTVPLGATPGAAYELRLFANNTYTRLATSAPFSVTASAATIAATPASVTAGSQVTATWSGIAAPTGTDWVGLYDSASAPNAALLAWAYTGGGAAGNLNLTVPPGATPGAAHELRLFTANTYTRLATSAPFSVVASTSAISAAPASVNAGGTVTGTWSGIAAPTATDWVGLYDSASAPDAALMAWAYTGGGAAGSLPLTVPVGAASGAAYELRLFSANTYTRLATSNAFSVAASAAAISASPASVANGTPVTATWSGIGSPSATDWVGLYDSSAAPDPAIVAWAYTGGAAAGSLNLTVPTGSAPGATYELRLYSNNTYTRLATSASFSVT